jgi:hypothetical protein
VVKSNKLGTRGRCDEAIAPSSQNPSGQPQTWVMVGMAQQAKQLLI